MVNLSMQINTWNNNNILKKLNPVTDSTSINCINQFNQHFRLDLDYFFNFFF